MVECKFSGREGALERILALPYGRSSVPVFSASRYPLNPQELPQSNQVADLVPGLSLIRIRFVTQ